MNAMRKVKISEPAILIRINRLYEEGMSAQALYEVTRGVWKIGARREAAMYAVAVYKGVVKEVYRIDHWCEAGTTHYATRSDIMVEGRWEFVGSVERVIRDKYVGKSVKHYFIPHAQNPFTYVNC